MRTITIRFRSIGDFTRLLDILNTLPMTCSMVQDHVVVEAKSLLGIASLDFGRTMQLVISSQLSEEAFNHLKHSLAFVSCKQ